MASIVESDVKIEEAKRQVEGAVKEGKAEEMVNTLLSVGKNIEEAVSKLRLNFDAKTLLLAQYQARAKGIPDHAKVK